MTTSIDTSLLLSLYETMLRIRFFEERVADLLPKKEIMGPAHLYTGQEGIAAGVCANLKPDDYLFGTHRSHGHYLAKGGDMKAMMAELYGRKTGCSGGKGGSMHLIAPEIGILGTVPLVAATIPIAVGTALASKLRHEKRVTVSFFGDGAVEEGVFHESMNLAAHRKLPVIFICENNFYSSHLHLLERRAKDNIVQNAEAHGMPGYSLDGNDVVAVYQTSREAVERAREGSGPAFLECRTYRWHGHVGPSLDLDVGVKRKDELGEWKKKDPILRLRERLLQEGLSKDSELEEIADKTTKEVEEAILFARSSPFPDKNDLLQHIFKSKDGEENR